MIRLSIPRFALFLSLLVPVAGFCADDDVAWIADKSGCKVANPFPQPGESITWNVDARTEQLTAKDCCSGLSTARPPIVTRAR